MIGNLYRSLFWRHGAGIFLLFFLLVSNREASAQGYKLRYTDTAAGAITFVGNTLGLNTAAGAGSVGAFITTNIALNAGGGFPNGTTLNWSNNSSSAVLRMPTNSTVLYAELIWAGTCETVSNAPANSASNVLSSVTNTSVHFFLPNGSSNSVVPDPTTLTIVTNFNAGLQQALFYVRSADVTALVKAAGAGTYTVGGVPAEISSLDGSDDCAGWTLAVVYGNSSLHQRNLSLFVGNYWINAASAASSPPVGIAGFCAPPTGAVNGYLFVSAMEGDSQTTGDQMEFGVTTNSFTALSGPNNPVNNFFSSQINYCQPDNLLGTTITNGYLDTSGTFGLSNSVTGSSKIYARQGWDITCVNASAALTNSATSAFAKFITSGDGYSASALALQIDVGSPVLTTSQTVDKGSTYVGDTLTYTVVVTNSGTADAVNLIFTDPLPFGTSYIANTFMTNGVVIAGANPVNGVGVPIIKQGSSYTATYKVLVNQIPPAAQFITAATINFQYAGACAQSPIINSTLVNANVETLVPLLNVNKTTSQTNLVPGTVFTYTINIPNVGTTNTADSAMNDQIPSGTTYVPGTTTNNGVHIPDIGPGGTNMPYTVTTEIHGPGRAAGVINVGDTVVVSFKVKISPTFPSFINNTATIYVNTNTPTSSQSAAANIPPIVADLAVGIVGAPNPVAAGTNITYTVTLTNLGPNAISAVTNSITNSLTLYLPLSQSISSPIYTPSSGVYNPLTGVWSGLNLPSNAVVTLTVSGMVLPGTTAGNIVSSVTVVPPAGIFDPVTNNNTASATNTVAQIVDLAVTISDGVTNVHQGDSLTYIVTAVNLGPSTLTSLSVSNSLSTNDLVFIPGLFANFTFTPDQGNYNPANGVWSGLDLTPGSSATLTLQATVLNNVSGFFTNTVIVSVPAGVTDPVLTNNTASDVDVILTAPDVAITKTGPTNVFAGTNFSYTLMLTNSGFAIASNVVASDVLPTNVTFVSASGNGTNNSGVVSWNLGNLAVNATSNLTLTVTAPTSGNITNVATSTASTPDSNPGNNTSPPVGTAVTPVADLAMGKSASASVVATSNLVYTISITNLGPSDASGVIMTDTLPFNVAFVSASGGGVHSGGGVSWAVGALNAGQVSNVTLTVTAPASGFITNTAKESSTTLDTNAVNNTSPPVITTVIPLALSADVSVTKSGPANVFAGTNFSYTITVTNAGSGTASNAVASDVLPTNVVFASASGNGTNIAGTVSWSLGNLILHATTNLTLTVTAPASGTITNSAIIASITADPNPANNTSPPVTTTVTPVADLAAGKSGPASVFAASNLTYTVSITNLGPSAASGVVVTDALPAGVTFVNAPGGVNNSGVVNWSLGNLTAGQISNLTVTVTAPASGTLTNTVIVNSPTGDPTPTNNTSPPVTTTVTLVADLAIGKTAPPIISATSNFTYTVFVTNLGPSTASSVVVTDSLPVGATFVSAPGGVNNSGVVSWSLGSLTAGQTSNLTVTVTAPASGTLVNTAIVNSPTGDPNPTNNTSPPVTTPVTPSADVAVTEGGPTNVLAGGTIVYTITVTNFGPSTASNVVINDNLPTNSIFVITTGGGTNNNGIVTWPTIPVLTNGGTFTFTVTVTAPPTGPLTNTVSGTSPTGDPNPANNNGTSPSAIVITTVTPSADLAIGKIGPSGNFLGASFSYTISVTNFGPLTATALSVTDNLPAGLAFVSSSPAAATNLSSQVIWTNLGNLASGAVTNLTLNVTATTRGTVTNFAFVGSLTVDPNASNNISSPVITAVTNRPPVAINDSGSTPKNVAVSIPVLANDSDPDGDALTIVSVNPTNGTANIVGTNVVFTPATNLIGTAIIGYTITDGFGGTNTALITINVTNRPPVALNDSGSTPKNVSVAIPVLVNDSDPDGDTLTIVSVSPTNGTANIVGTNVVFLPATNFIGTATVGYTITDGFSGTNTALITINVTNRPPIAVNDSATTPKNVQVTIPVLGNDSDPDGDALAIVNVNPTNGTANIIGTNVVFTPATNFIGTATVGYTITDGFGGTNAALITINVTNRPPVAINDSGSTSKNISVTVPVLVNDNDPDGDTLTVISVAPTNGTAIISGTNVVFTPATNFIGTTTIGYTITDGFGGTNSALITINVTNRQPVAVDDSASTPKNVSVAIPVLANDSDPDGDILAIVSVAPTNGTAVISGTNVVFTPATNFTGTATVGYTITDGFGGTNTALITISVTNRPPVAVNDSSSTPKNIFVTIPVLVNDSDPDGDALTIVSVNPTNGTAVINGTNVIFTPATNFIGTATVGYTITDGFGGTNSALITISVGNNPPVAVNDSYSVGENTPLVVPAASGVLTNDTDLDGDPLTAILTNGPSHGTLTLNTNGGFTYTPATNFTGVDSFTYVANDGTTNSGVATVTLTVLPSADVVVLKTGSVSGVAGSNLVYTITVTNHGPATATNVLVSDQLPAGLTFVSATPATAVVSTNNLVTWPVFNQAKNAKSTFTVTVVSPDGGFFTNVAFGTSSTFDGNPTNNNGTATNSQVVTTVTPRADLAVFKTGNTSVAASGAVNYTITVTNIGPSTATNVVVTDTLPLAVAFQSASGSYNLIGNVLTWPVTTLAKGATTNFTVFVTAPANGSFTNIAAAGSDTPDSNPTNNNGAAASSKVTTTVVPAADVQIAVFGPPSVTVGDGFSYTLVVSNGGPSIAINTLVTNVLPTNLVFASASGGGTNKNGLVTWPVFPVLTNGQFTNLILTVTPSAGASTNFPTTNSFNFIETNTTPTVGFLTNSASAFAATFDPNLTNNSASTAYTNAEVQTVIVPGVFSIFIATNDYPTNLPSFTLTNTITPIGNDLFIVGTSAFNPQTGLYEEDVTVTNLGTVAVHALRLYIGKLRSGVTLYNATGTNNGVPYVEYDPPYNSPLNPFPAADSSVTFVLEFFVANRLPFTNSLTAVAINPPATGPTNGTQVVITGEFLDQRNPDDIRFLIEFASIPGRTYTILYSDDMVTWNIAKPSIVASANTTQWYDDGPPETLSKPSSSGSRFYRVLLDP